MTIGEKLEGKQDILISLTADIVAAYVGNNVCRGADLPILIKDVYAALNKAVMVEEEKQDQVEPVVEKPKPAVHPKRSVTDSYIICLEDGRRFKSLKRHLMAHYDLTPEQYREKWGLAPDYPMVAPSYAKERARLAKKMGLGRKKQNMK